MRTGPFHQILVRSSYGYVWNFFLGGFKTSTASRLLKPHFYLSCLQLCQWKSQDTVQAGCHVAVSIITHPCLSLFFYISIYIYRIYIYICQIWSKLCKVVAAGVKKSSSLLEMDHSSWMCRPGFDSTTNNVAFKSLTLSMSKLLRVCVLVCVCVRVCVLTLCSFPVWFEKGG